MNTIEVPNELFCRCGIPMKVIQGEFGIVIECETCGSFVSIEDPAEFQRLAAILDAYWAGKQKEFSDVTD